MRSGLASKASNRVDVAPSPDDDEEVAAADDGADDDAEARQEALAARSTRRRLACRVARASTSVVASLFK